MHIGFSAISRQEVKEMLAGITGQLKGNEPVEGMVRIYRGETKGNENILPDWVRETKEYKETLGATGRWFYTTYGEAKKFADDFGNGKVSYADIPAVDLEKYRAENQGAKKFAAIGRGHEELFISKEMADTRQPFTGGELAMR